MNAIFKALNDVTRREILELLKVKIYRQVKLRIISIFQNQYFTSFGHFEACRFNHFRKNGQFIIYSINTTVMEDVLQWILTLKNKNNETLPLKRIAFNWNCIGTFHLAIIWNTLPEKTTHWNYKGEVDKWGDKYSLIALLFYCLF
jgi:hypothetical protein